MSRRAQWGLLVGINAFLFVCLETCAFATAGVMSATGFSGGEAFRTYKHTFHPLITGRSLRGSAKIGMESDMSQWSSYDPWLGYRPDTNNNNGLYVTDRYGFISSNRERDLSIKRPGTYRIFVLGGSTMAGHGASSAERTIPARLEEILNKAGRGRYEVVNAAVPGYYSSQELASTVNELLYLSPDMILVMDGYNDFFKLFQEPPSHERPGIYYHWNYYQEYLHDHINALNTGFQLPPRLRLCNYSYFCDMFLRLLWKIGQPKGSLTPPSTAPENPAGAGPRSDLGPADFSEVLAHYETNVRLMAEAAQIRRVTFLAVLQPLLVFKKKHSPAEESQLQAQVKLVADSMKVDAKRTLENGFSAASRNLHLPLGTRFVDASALFADRHEELFVDWVHYNDAGNEVIAQFLSQQILAAKN